MISPYVQVINFFVAMPAIDEPEALMQGRIVEFWEVPFGHDPTKEEVYSRMPQERPAGAISVVYCLN